MTHRRAQSDGVAGRWLGQAEALRPASNDTWTEALRRTGEPLAIVALDDGLALASAGPIVLHGDDSAGLPLIAYARPQSPATLGSAEFRAFHGVRAAYVAGAMANGIASEDLVEAMARARLLSFFGSAGLSLERVDRAITRLEGLPADAPRGFNLIHSPNEPELESALVDLYLARNVTCIEASAFLGVTLPLVRYRAAGLVPGPDGSVRVTRRIVGKVSRVEVASKFLSPAPQELLKKLVDSGQITAVQADLATRVPLVDDLTAEADSGGHTDNRPALALLPTLTTLRDRIAGQAGYTTAPRVGAAGGIATPQSAAAAFSMGAAYVVTGSINQACVEAGTSDTVRRLLAQAQQADVTMAPAADMFEMGVKVQVLKRGTMFAMRGTRLHDLYSSYGSLDEIPPAERTKLERTVFGATLDDVWVQTQAYFRDVDPRQIERAASDPKHKMALVFRWYLGQSSHWANAGTAGRELDYQVWCGPAMGAFNAWVEGTALAEPSARRVVDVADALLDGTASWIRQADLAAQGVEIPAAAVAAAITPSSSAVASPRARRPAVPHARSLHAPSSRGPTQ